MTAALLSVELVIAGGGAALAMIGAVAALLSANAIKRVGGLLVSGFGAVAVLAAMGAGSGPILVGVAVLFVYAAIGTAIVVRLQESYGSIEAPEIDAADAESDAQERAS